MINLLVSIAIAAPMFVCTHKTPDLPKVKFRGETYQETFDKTVRMCLSLRIEQYSVLRLRAPTTERVILFMEECVNNTYCNKGN